MNKCVILLLAVCLVSVSAFVKRDAPAASESDDIVAQSQKTLTEAVKKIGETFSMENINKGLKEVMTNVNKALDTLKATEAPKA